MAFSMSASRYCKAASSLLLLLLLLATAPRPVSAACECGYLLNNQDQGPDPSLFTESIESNFKQIKKFAGNADWQREEFNVSAEAGRGPYARMFTPDNVELVTSGKASANSNDSDTGLQLLVGGKLVNGEVTTSEIDTARTDIFYGSFRVGMKLPNVPGTCGAFFWYFNDTWEMDMEFLTRQFDKVNGVFPVNLVLQSRESVEAGFNAAGTPTFQTVDLAFDPTDNFNEFRFDFFPGQVHFYANSLLLATMNGSAVPSGPGHLSVSHWSNGNPLWSGGPPPKDAVLTVSYVKAYFNSTDPKRQADYEKRCSGFKGTGDGRCLIADVLATNASSGGTFLGSDDSKSGALHIDLKWSMITTFLLLALTFGML